MTTETTSRADEQFMRNALGASIRIGILALLLYYCLRIVGPFLNITLWGMIIAIAVFPMHRKFTAMLGDKPKLSATLIVVIALTALILPVTLMTESGLESAQRLGTELRTGQLSIPPPSDKVATWPLVGEKLHSLWAGAAENLQSTLRQFQPQLVAAGEWLLKAVGSAAGGVLAFIVSIIIAGVFMVSAEGCYAAARKIMSELAGERGHELTDLSVATIRSVAKGVLGVAIIQTLLAAVGLIAMDVTATGIILGIILFVAVVQIPTLLVIGPLIVWVYSTAEPGPATAFAVYMLLVALSDNFLKPILLGRGVEIPALVILLGAIGGAIFAGLIGLFLGAVILALGYKLLLAWMDPESVEESLPETNEGA